MREAVKRQSRVTSCRAAQCPVSGRMNETGRCLLLARTETTLNDGIPLGIRPLPKSKLDYPLGMRQGGTRCFCPVLGGIPQLIVTDCD